MYVIRAGPAHRSLCVRYKPRLGRDLQSSRWSGNGAMVTSHLRTSRNKKRVDTPDLSQRISCLEKMRVKSRINEPRLGRTISVKSDAACFRVCDIWYGLSRDTRYVLHAFFMRRKDTSSSWCRFVALTFITIPPTDDPLSEVKAIRASRRRTSP